MSYSDYNSRNFSSSTSLEGHEIPLKREYFMLIKNGRKTVEGRVKTGPFRNARQGDQITFKNGQDFVKCRITGIATYASFRAMLEAEGLENCLPGARSLDDGVRIYDDIPGYAQKANRFGVIALRIAKVEADRPNSTAIPTVRSSAPRTDGSKTIDLRSPVPRSNGSQMDYDRRQIPDQDHDKPRDSIQRGAPSISSSRDYDRDREYDQTREIPSSRHVSERDRFDDKYLDKQTALPSVKQELPSRKRKLDGIREEVESNKEEKEEPVTKKARHDSETLNKKD